MAQPMILPKGIVLNDPGIYREVASYDVIPPEKLYQYWHVYTTTFRKLIDPTAYRLEQFWFRVWGSDRRFLSGKELARLFEEFSDGPTFVPLRGPPNRYEGPPRPRRTHPQPRPGPGPRIQSEMDASQKQQRRHRKETSPPDKAGLKEPTPSSSRPPPTHTILKKPRGPSTSGRRPTARIITPDEEAKDKAEETETEIVAHGMETNGKEANGHVKDVVDKGKGKMIDEIKEEEEGPPKSKAAAGADTTDMPPPPRPLQLKSEKKGTPTKGTSAKKFPVVTPTKPRRPGLVRRQSSQSSTDSMSGASGTGAKLGSHRTIKTVIMDDNGNSDRQTEEGSSSSSAGSMLTIAGYKSSGKLPIPNSGSSSFSQSEHQLENRPTSTQQLYASNPPPRSPTKALPQPIQAPPPVAGFVSAPARQSSAILPPSMVRSRSQAEIKPASVESVTVGFKARNNFYGEAQNPETPGMTRDGSSSSLAIGPAVGTVNHGMPTAATSTASTSNLDAMRLRPTPRTVTEDIEFGAAKSALRIARDKLSDRERQR